MNHSGDQALDLLASLIQLACLVNPSQPGATKPRVIRADPNPCPSTSELVRTKVADPFESNSRCSKVQGLMADIVTAKGQEELRSDGAQTTVFFTQGWMAVADGKG